MNKPISTRAKNVMAEHGIESVEVLRHQIITRGTQFLALTPNCGARTLNELLSIAGCDNSYFPPTEVDKAIAYLEAKGYTVTPPYRSITA